jgi:N-acetylglucosamine-6-phosphate deacetylase
MTSAATTSVLLHGGRIVCPDRLIRSGALLVESGEIRAIFDSKAIGVKADSSIDLNGSLLFPGFIDIHIHGAAGVDMMTADADAVRRVSGFLAHEGVTSWLPTLVPGSPAEYESAITAIQQVITATAADQNLSRPLARVIGIHYEGPFVNSEQCGALHREHFRTFKQIADLDSLPNLDHPGAIHLITLAPEIEGGIELIKELDRRGWIVSIGHTRAAVPILNEALAAGARHMTHFMNAMTPLHHRDLGAVGWGLTREEVTCDMIADGIHLAPAVLKLIAKCKTADRVSLISDAIAATGMGDGDFQIWGETIQVKEGRTRNSHGSIAGSVITMLDAVKMILSLGKSELDVARMASTNPARLLGIDNVCGSIQEGKRADLVAIDENGAVQLAMVGGSIV